jgi:hypothetical protein
MFMTLCNPMSDSPPISDCVRWSVALVFFAAIAHGIAALPSRLLSLLIHGAVASPRRGYCTSPRAVNQTRLVTSRRGSLLTRRCMPAILRSPRIARPPESGKAWAAGLFSRLTNAGGSTAPGIAPGSPLMRPVSQWASVGSADVFSPRVSA